MYHGYLGCMYPTLHSTVIQFFGFVCGSKVRAVHQLSKKTFHTKLLFVFSQSSTVNLPTSISIPNTLYVTFLRTPRTRLPPSHRNPSSDYRAPRSGRAPYASPQHSHSREQPPGPLRRTPLGKPRTLFPWPYRTPHNTACQHLELLAIQTQYMHLQN